MSHVLRLVVAVLMLVGGSAHALVPQTQSFAIAGTDVFRPTPAQACDDGLVAYAQVYQVVVTGHQFHPVGNNGNPGCGIGFTRPDGSGYQEAMVGFNSGPPACPANSTPSGSQCQCTSPYVENAAKTACKLPAVQCTPGRVISSGYFDAGSAVAKGPPYIVCDKGCSAAFDGSFPEGSALVGGKMHYFAKGVYSQNGSQCDSGGGPGDPSGDGNAPKPSDAVPPDSCAPGEAAGVVNGKGVCAPDMTQEGDGTKPPPDPKPPESSDKKSSESTTETTKNPDGSKTVVTTKTTKNTDGTSTKEVTTKKYDKDGNEISSKSETTGSGVTKEAGKEADDAKKDKCSKNSSDTGCGGDPKEVNGAELYKAKTDSVKGILSGAKDNLLSSPIGSAAGNFFSVSGGGSCPTVSGRIPFIDKVVTFDTFCTEFAMVMLLTIKGVLLLLATWWAFRIAIE